MNTRVIFLLTCLLAPVVTVSAQVQFEDTSDKLGFTRGTETWGISWGNLDDDNYPDLWNSGHRDFPRLYRNTGTGDFNEVAMYYDRAQNGYWLSNTSFDVHGGAWGDFDNDGDDDLLVGDENQLFTNLNSQGGLFINSEFEANQQYATWNNTDNDRELESDLSCGGEREGQYILLFDLNVDGETDIICGQEGVFPVSVGNAPASFLPNVRLLNDVAIADFNNDLRTDIVGTRGATRTNGAAKVNDNRIEAWITANSSEFVFSADGAVKFILDGDGGGVFLRAEVFDLNTSGVSSAEGRGVAIEYDSGAELWRVQNIGTSQAYVRIIAENEVSEPVMASFSERDSPISTAHGINTPSGVEWVENTGLEDPKRCVSIVAADFDNDMDVDIYMACRHGPSNLANRYFDNQGDGTFEEVFSHGGEGPVGAGVDVGVAESIATADYDVDGFMDLAVSNGLLFYPVSLGGPDTLLRNRGNNNHWIEMDLNGTVSPRAAIGAKVFVTAGGVTQLREQSAGHHRWAQNSSRIHFGLAGNTTVDEIRIEWPSGAVDTYSGIAADRLYEVNENLGIEPAVLGPPNFITIDEGEECGEPAYTTTLGPALLIWRVCGTDEWRIRARGGLSRLTEDRDLNLTASLVSADRPFDRVRELNLDNNDVLNDSNANRVDFSLTIRSDGTNTKGINFNSNGQSGTCLDIDSSDFEVIYLGDTGKRIDLPYDLSARLPVCGPGPIGSDTDGDGVNDNVDAFPNNPNETTDTDGDRVGDNSDAFPNNPNESVDSDGDRVGDNSDAFPNNPNESVDTDGDRVGDNSDAFPNDPNESVDSDGDRVGDNSDAFPNNPNESVDTDGDRVGDNSDAFPNNPNESLDSDGDGVGNNADAFPNNANETADTDGDGVGNNADAFPFDPTETTDSDGDGIGDNSDPLPNDPNNFVDSDGDGVADASDAFPNDPNETRDTDGDGVGDNADAFPNNANESVDSDGDGVGDNSDAFRNNPNESADSDGDGVGDNSDAFPNDASESADSDGDGVGDNSDPFPNDPNNLPIVPVTNVAVGQVAVQSSTGFGGLASRAVDGNTNGVYRNDSVTHTEFEFAPWWEVDLGAVHDIETVVVWNRTDNCCTSRLINFDVLVSDVPFASNDLNAIRSDSNVLSMNHPGVAERQSDFEVNRTGRYVRIQLVGNGNPLSLAEVQVMARPFLDSDGDGVSDMDDAFPNDPSETTDSDGDGVGDNSDVDADNDGLRNAAEVPLNGASGVQLVDDFETDLGWVRDPFGTDTATTGLWEVGTPGETIDSGMPIQLGFTTSGTRALITDGAVGTRPGSFDVDAGVTSIMSPLFPVPTSARLLRFNYNFAHRNTAEEIDFFRVSVRANGSQQTVFEQFGVSGLQRAGEWLPVSVDISSFAGQSIQVLVEAADNSATILEAGLDDLEFEVGGSFGSDADLDGVDNQNDLDSDNDSIPDVIEIGLSDVDNDFIVDNLLGDQGSVSVPLDTDGDGIPDFLDLESNNAANDGTAYDINTGFFAASDSNGDGRLNSLDVGGGFDIDADGIDDLIDTDTVNLGNGGFTQIPLAGIECFEPAFDRSTERGLFVWRDCPSGQWNVRLTNGGIAGGVSASGDISTSSGFGSISEFSLEGNDFFDTVSDPNIIEYNVRAFNVAQDGFGFLPNGPRTCLTVETDAPLLLGETRTPFTSPLNLDTLQSCGIELDPPQCGEPTFDSATEPGAYLWQECNAGTAANGEEWRLRIVAGGNSFAPYSGIVTTSNPFTNVQGLFIENNTGTDVIEGGVGDSELNFILFVAGGGIDGIDFTIPSGGQTCFDVQSLPTGSQVLVGRDRLPMTQRFNLENLGVCF